MRKDVQYLAFYAFRKRQLKLQWGLSWWPSGKESACLCRGHGLNPLRHNYWAHVLQWLKPKPLRAHAQQKRSHHNKTKPPLTATREKPACSNEDLAQTINKIESVFNQNKELGKAQIRLSRLVQSLVLTSLVGELVKRDKTCRSLNSLVAQSSKCPWFTMAIETNGLKKKNSFAWKLFWSCILSLAFRVQLEM